MQDILISIELDDIILDFILSFSRYASRYFLKHTILEQAFDQLCAAGFRYIHKEIKYKLLVTRENVYNANSRDQGHLT